MLMELLVEFQDFANVHDTILVMILIPIFEYIFYENMVLIDEHVHYNVQSIYIIYFFYEHVDLES